MVPRWSLAALVLVTAVGAASVVGPMAQAGITPEAPCVKVNAVDLGSGNCQAYLCTALMFNGGIDSGCDVEVNPGGNRLLVQIIATPALMPSPWDFRIVAWDFTMKREASCTPWTGPPTPPPEPLSLPPCELFGPGPWAVNAFYMALPQMDPANPTTYSLGTLHIYYGPSPLI